MALSLDEALGMSLIDEADESIHVDVNTRQITIPESQKLFGVESDADVEVKHIVIDGRYADGNRDLSKLAWRVIYRNANKETSYYLIPSVVANENSIEMDWLIKRSVVAYKGTVDFILCAFATTSSGEVTPEWNSTLGQGMVLEGLEASEIDIGKESVDELSKILYETITAKDAAAKSAADAGSAAGSIKDSMAQIAANKEAIGQLKEDLVYGFNDNASYKEHTVDDSLKAIGTPSPLVSSCITISEVLRTFFIKTIKLYVKSSVKDTITIKLLEEPEYGSNAYYETSVEVEVDTNKLVEIEVNKLFFRGNSLNILTESKVSLESGTKAMYYYVRNEGTKICEYLKVKKRNQ